MTRAITWTNAANRIEGSFPFDASAEAFGQYIRERFDLIRHAVRETDLLVCDGDADFGQDEELYLLDTKYVSGVERAVWTTRCMIDRGPKKPSATPGFIVGEFARFEQFTLVGECWNPAEDCGIIGWRDVLSDETVRAEYVRPQAGELILVNCVIDGRKNCDWPVYVWVPYVQSRKLTIIGGEIYSCRIGVTLGYSGSAPQQQSLIDGVTFHLDANGSKSLGESSAYSDDRGAVLAAVVVREGTHVMRNCTVEAVGLKAQFDPGYKPPKYGVNRIAALVTDHFSTDPQKCDITIENCRVSKLDPGLSTVSNDIDVRHCTPKIIVDTAKVQAAQLAGAKAVKDATTKAQAVVAAARGGSNADGSYRQWQPPVKGK